MDDVTDIVRPRGHRGGRRGKAARARRGNLIYTRDSLDIVQRPKARIHDVDGTLADVSTIRHFVLRAKDLKDFDSFHAASEFVPAIPQAVEYMRETVELGYVPLVVTARMQKWKKVTERFLAREVLFADGTPIPYDGPFHRQDGDRRSDRIVKLEILRYLRKHYDIVGAIDDNPEVIELWKSQGIPTTIVPGWMSEDAKKYTDLANKVS